MGKQNIKKVGKIECRWDGDLNEPGDEIAINFSLGLWKSEGTIKLQTDAAGKPGYLVQASFLRKPKKAFGEMRHAIAFMAVNFACEAKQYLMPKPSSQGHTIN